MSGTRLAQITVRLMSTPASLSTTDSEGLLGPFCHSKCLRWVSGSVTGRSRVLAVPAWRSDGVNRGLMPSCCVASVAASRHSMLLSSSSGPHRSWFRGGTGAPVASASFGLRLMIHSRAASSTRKSWRWAGLSGFCVTSSWAVSTRLIADLAAWGRLCLRTRANHVSVVPSRDTRSAGCCVTTKVPTGAARGAWPKRIAMTYLSKWLSPLSAPSVLKALAASKPLAACLPRQERRPSAMTRRSSGTVIGRCQIGAQNSPFTTSPSAAE